MFTPRNINFCLLFADLCGPRLESLLLGLDLVAESLSFIYAQGDGVMSYIIGGLNEPLSPS